MNNRMNVQAEQWTRAFPLGPDHVALFSGRDYRRAAEGLCEDLRRGRRLLCLAGPPGIGKSMLLHNLRTRLPRGFVGEVAQPALGGLLSRLAAGLGLSSDADEAAVRAGLQAIYAAGCGEGLPIIQLIDDAETLTHADLALLRRLFQPVQGQVVLAGQPRLLALFEGAAPPDRVYHLEPLSSDEVGAYIRHRLHEAGFDRGLLDTEAVAAVSAYSGGVPRLINLLCFAVMSDAAHEPAAPIAAARVHDAVRHRAAQGGYPFVRPPAGAADAVPPPMVAMVVDDARRRRGLFGTGYGRMGLAMTGVALVVFGQLSVGGRGREEMARTMSAMSDSAAHYLHQAQGALAEWASFSLSPGEGAPAGDAAAGMPEEPVAADVPVPPPAAPPAPVQRPAAPAADPDEAPRLSAEERAHLARLYTERAEYERRNRRFSDALASIASGLEEDPGNHALLDMRRQVLAELAAQQ